MVLFNMDIQPFIFFVDRLGVSQREGLESQAVFYGQSRIDQNLTKVLDKETVILIAEINFMGEKLLTSSLDERHCQINHCGRIKKCGSSAQFGSMIAQRTVFHISKIISHSLLSQKRGL